MQVGLEDLWHSYLQQATLIVKVVSLCHVSDLVKDLAHRRLLGYKPADSGSSLKVRCFFFP